MQPCQEYQQHFLHGPAPQSLSMAQQVQYIYQHVCLHTSCHLAGNLNRCHSLSHPQGIKESSRAKRGKGVQGQEAAWRYAVLSIMKDSIINMKEVGCEAMEWECAIRKLLGSPHLRHSPPLLRSRWTHRGRQWDRVASAAKVTGEVCQRPRFEAGPETHPQRWRCVGMAGCLLCFGG